MGVPVFRARPDPPERPVSDFARVQELSIEDDVDFTVGLVQRGSGAEQRVRRHKHNQDHHGDMEREARQHALARRSPGYSEYAPYDFHGFHQAIDLNRSE
jgi:hypothetical protein